MGQARNQGFPKGGAKRGVVLWAQDHRVKCSEGGRGCRGQSPLHRKFLEFCYEID